MQHMQRGKIGECERAGEAEDLLIKILLHGIREIRIEIDGSEYIFVFLFFILARQPQRTWAVAQQLHVDAAEQPLHEARILGRLDEQVMAIAQDHADGLQEGPADQHIQADFEARPVWLDQRLQLLAALVDHDGLQLGRGTAATRFHHADAHAWNHVDDSQIRLVVFRQRHGAQDRSLLGHAALGHVQDVLECIHADHASWFAWLREWYDARD